MGPVDDSTAAEDAMRLPGTSEVDAAAVEVPSHGQQEPLPAVSNSYILCFIASFIILLVL